MKIINHCASEWKPVTSSQVFNGATNAAICFRASKRTYAHLKKAGLEVRGKSPLPFMAAQHLPWVHLVLPMVKAWRNSRWIHMSWVWNELMSEIWFLLVIWVEVQNKEKHLVELIVSKGEGHTPAPSQQEPVTTFGHGHTQRTALNRTSSWKVKSKQLSISDFAKLGQDCRAHFFLR